MIGRLHHVILDCPDPGALAAFYSELLGLPITYQSDDWVVIAANETSSGLAFQLAPDHRPPSWPQSFRGLEVRLLIVLLPGLGCGVCLAGGGGRGRSPGMPGCAPAPTAPDWSPFLLS
jgi:catechol 2,3-dioxygenase-like lactoylglutathione lyase family enzyme